MGDMIYRPLIEDMTWSYSRISSFHDCPYRWYLRYICKVEETPRFFSSYGSFVHRLLEQYYKGEASKDDIYIKFLLSFSSEVQGPRPQESTVQKYISDAADYLRNLEPIPITPLETEKGLAFNIGGIPFIGYIDFLGKTEDGLVIVDHKSRDLKPRSKRKQPTAKDKELDEALRQLYLYAEAVRQEYGVFPSRLCFNCFRVDRFISEPFNEETFKETVKWAEDTIHEIEDTNEFPPNLDYFGCHYICGVSDECCYKQLGW